MQALHKGRCEQINKFAWNYNKAMNAWTQRTSWGRSLKLGICEGLGAGFCAGKLGKRAKIYIPGNINTQMIMVPFSVLGRLGHQGSIENFCNFSNIKLEFQCICCKVRKLPISVLKSAFLGQNRLNNYRVYSQCLQYLEYITLEKGGLQTQVFILLL